MYSHHLLNITLTSSTTTDKKGLKPKAFTINNVPFKWILIYPHLLDLIRNLW